MSQVYKSEVAGSCAAIDIVLPYHCSLSLASFLHQNPLIFATANTLTFVNQRRQTIQKSDRILHQDLVLLVLQGPLTQWCDSTVSLRRKAVGAGEVMGDVKSKVS